MTKQNNFERKYLAKKIVHSEQPRKKVLASTIQSISQHALESTSEQIGVNNFRS